MNKKDKYNYLAKNTMIFTISSFGSQILTFLLVPLYTSVLSTADYGTADLITTTSNLLIYVFTLNIADSVLRFAIDKKSNQEDILAYGCKIFLVGSLLFAVIVSGASAFHLVNWDDSCYIFLVLTFMSTALNQILGNYLRAIDNISAVAVAGVLSTAVTIASNIVLLLVMRIGVYGYMISIILGSLISCVYSFIKINRSVRVIFNAKCSPTVKKKMVQYSVPLIFNGVAWWINNSIDKYFVTAIKGVAENGIYSVSYKIPTMLTVFQSIFSQAWNLSAIREFDKNDTDGFFSSAYDMYQTVLVTLCTGLIIINIPLAKFLFAKDFFVAWRCSSILVLSLVFNALSGFIGSIFSAVKNSKIFAVSTVSAACVNMVLNAVLIPQYGAEGAAVATTISFFIIWLIRLVCARRIIKWKISLKRDILTYLLLVVQLVLEKMPGHMYIAQAGIVICILLLYRKKYESVIGIVINKLRRKG